MSSDEILDQLQKNKSNQRIGSEVFGVAIDSEDIKPGLPVKDIIKEMRQASKEDLIRASDNQPQLC